MAPCLKSSALCRMRHSRRSCAKMCRAAGGELEQIQLLLGHASVQTTERRSEERRGGEVTGVQTCALPIYAACGIAGAVARKCVGRQVANWSRFSCSSGTRPFKRRNGDRKSAVEGK